MRNIFSIVVVVGAGLIVASEAAPQPPAKIRPATIGEFAVQVSTALGYEDPVPEAAARNLRLLGVDLGTDFGAPLTEGVAARVMADLGYSVVQPLEPSAPVSENRAGFLAGTLASSGLPAGAVPEGFGPSNGFPPIMECLQSPNVGVCTQCCVALLPPRFPTGLGYQLCNGVCRFNTPPVSPSSPG